MKSPEGNYKVMECVLKVTKQGLFWTNRETLQISKVLQIVPFQ